MSANVSSASSPLLSVIIPCFNHGAYIDEAVGSVLAQTYKNFEIIVVNDGSTDPLTSALLASYDRPYTSVIHTKNQGLAAARNTGIAAAKGKYILPLDADDRIAETFLERAVQILEANERIGIVGSEVELFGAQTGRLTLPAYGFPLILVQCPFVCTSAFRRCDWEAAGGYNTNLKHGHEDWDFWLSLIELGREGYRIPEVLFYYRKTPGSMLESMTTERRINAQSQMFRNHTKLYCDNIEAVFGFLHRLHAVAVSASNQLADSVKAASKGQDVVICDDNGPVAKLVSLRSTTQAAPPRPQ